MNERNAAQVGGAGLLGRDHGTALERTASKRTTASGKALQGKLDYLAVALTDPDDDRPLGTLQR